MLRVTNFLALLLLLPLVACTAPHAAKQDIAAYPFRHSDFDYRVAWKTFQSDKGFVIDGIMKNVRYAYIDSLDLTISVIGKNNKVRARGTSIPVPQHSRIDEVIPFAVKLPNVSAEQGDILQFLIHYKGSEGGRNEGIDWRSSFAVDALSGVTLDKEGTAHPEKW